jgi:putative aldouronate transport system permease protein
MSDPQNYPMHSYLRTVVVNLDMRRLGEIDPGVLVFVSEHVLQAAQILVATVPIPITCPFLQQSFITGITLGALHSAA